MSHAPAGGDRDAESICPVGVVHSTAGQDTGVSPLRQTMKPFGSGRDDGALYHPGDAVKYLLGDSFHPGGLRLTEELASLLSLSPATTVLDVASGKGTTAFFLAEKFRCRVIGIDLSEQNILDATTEAAARGLSDLATFRLADAEGLPFDAGVFDAIVCECAFCTFPSKQTAAAEFERVLKPGGRVGISDITKDGTSLPELDGLLAWIACIGDAQPLEKYAAWLAATGLRITHSEHKSHYLQEMVQDIRGKLLMAEIMIGLKKLRLPGLDIQQAKSFATAANDAIRDKKLGYALLIAQKPE